MTIQEKTKLKLLNLKIKLWIKDRHNKGLFSLFDAAFSKKYLEKNLNYDNLNYIYDCITSWDKYNNISYNVGMSLDNLAKDNTIMVHRVKLNLDTKKEGLQTNSTLLNMMNEGLINQGHANAVGGSAFSKTPSALTLTMTPLVGLTGYINLVAPYKENDTVIFAVFPKDLVDEDGQLVNGHQYSDIYDLSEKHPRIKSEFMLGALLKKDNSLDEFYTKDEIINAKEISMKK